MANTHYLLLSLLLTLTTTVEAQVAGYGELGVAFQRGPGDEFVVRGRDFALHLTASGQRLELRDRADGRATVTTEFVGGRAASIAGEGLPTGRVNIYRSRHSASWRTGMPQFAAVRCTGVWRGIDVVYHGRRKLLEYDFVVAPGADPARIALRFDGASARIDGGDLLLQSAAGIVRHEAPVASQGDRSVAARWSLDGTTATIELGDYDPTERLVIDPVIRYVTHLGGSGGDEGLRIAAAPDGSAIVVGKTQSANFPVQSPVQPSRNGTMDLFIAKLTPAGTALSWSTYFGGEFAESDSHDITLLDDGSVAITGTTTSFDFPVTPGAFQSAKQAGVVAFLAIFGANGGLEYSTYYSGSRSESAFAIAAFGDSIYIGGRGGSDDLPGAALGFQRLPAGGGGLAPDGFVARFSRLTGQPQSATFIGGATSIETVFALDAGPHGVAVAGNTKSVELPTANGFQANLGGGTDGFVAVLDLGLSALRYGSYIGGSNNENNQSSVAPTDVAFGPAGAVHVVGRTASPDFPVTNDAMQGAPGGLGDAFFSVIDPTLVGAPSLVYSTYYGGSRGDDARGVAVDAAGNVYVAGSTDSSDIALAHELMGTSGNDALLAVFDSSRRLRFATPIGQPSQTVVAAGVAIGSGGDAFITGRTSGVPGLPTTAGAFQSGPQGQTDAWVARVAVPFAGQSNYGAGHPGTNGVPALATDADPILGTTIDLSIGNSLPVATPGVLAISTFEGFTPTPFGGVLLVQNFFTINVTVAAGGTALSLDIPPARNLCGVELFFQALLVDPGASHGVSFSPGLRLDLGI